MSESSPAACRFATRDRTAFCFLFIGLLNIDSALTPFGFAGRDDAYGFFRVIFILHAVYVDNQQHSARRGTDGVPPLLAIHDAVLAQNFAGIVENKRRALEREAVVLLQVDAVLFTIPVTLHCY